jgi:D-amino peptidase
LSMKVYVICDLEGTAGVVDFRQQCCFDGAYYHQARRLATLELNALVEGALEGGATEIVAWDGHGGFPGGLDVELLLPGCQMVMGAGDGGPVGIDSSYDAVFLLGFHAMVGTTRAVLCHSFWPGVAGCWVNGLPVGEIGMNIAGAGEHGVPAVFISGDRAAVEEARALVPDIEGIVVKEGLVPEVRGLAQAPTLSQSPQKARELIRDGAKRAMAKARSIAPFRFEPPYRLRTQFTEAKYADENANRPNVKRIDATTIEVEGTDFLSL